jgi:hypothetical protein
MVEVFCMICGNGTMKPVEIVPRMGEVRRENDGGGESN